MERQSAKRQLEHMDDSLCVVGLKQGLSDANNISYATDDSASQVAGFSFQPKHWIFPRIVGDTSDLQYIAPRSRTNLCRGYCRPNDCLAAKGVLKVDNQGEIGQLEV
jgi:hypothetical protein